MATTDKLTALQRIPLFNGVPATVLERMASRTSFVALNPGQMVMDYDDESTDVLFVMEGSIRVSVHTADGGHARILSDFHAGDLVGEMAAIDGAPRSARVEALVRSRLCLMPAEVFLSAAAEVPAVGLRIMRLLTARIRAQTRTLLEHTALPTRFRVAVELLRAARPRADGTRVISPPPNQEHLANRVGARRETVSRELGVLERAGLLQRSRTSILLPNPQALEALIQRGPGARG